GWTARPVGVLVRRAAELLTPSLGGPRCSPTLGPPSPTPRNRETIMTNHIQFNLDLDSATGVKALLALAGAFAPQKISLGQVVRGTSVDEAARELDFDMRQLHVVPEGGNDPEDEAEEPAPGPPAAE